MERYKLIKDLPTFKVGDKFHLSINGNLVHDESGEAAYMKHTLKKFPNILEDWFEKIEDAGPWRPKDGERYWTISGLGDCHEASWNDNGLDLARYDIGNYFKTREDAVKATEWLKAFKVLRDDTKGFKPKIDLLMSMFITISTTKACGCVQMEPTSILSSTLVGENRR